MIQRSIAGPTDLAKLIYDKFIQYLSLYRQVKKWERNGLLTNDKNLSNWVIRVSEDFHSPVFNFMKQLLTAKSILYVDETYAQIINQTVSQVSVTPIIGFSVAYLAKANHSSLSRSRSVLEDFTANFKGMIICDGYSAYGNLPVITFANC